jgi:hypothetical protein
LRCGFCLRRSTAAHRLYQRINGLIGAYGLTNTNGPTYAPLELADIDQNNQSDAERGRARFRSLFPGMYITMTVEGSYQNLRRFIREVETGNEFVIISSVELAPSESSGTAAAETTVAPAETYINPITGMPEQTIPSRLSPAAAPMASVSHLGLRWRHIFSERTGQLKPSCSKSRLVLLSRCEF